jgi:hypothetical protein
VDQYFSGAWITFFLTITKHYGGTHIKGNESFYIDKFEVQKKIKKNHPDKDMIDEVFSIIEEAFTETYNYNEPEFTETDEEVIDQSIGAEEVNKGYDLKHYLSDQPICREERQFALFFANKLSKNDCSTKRILTDGGLLKDGETIEKVFFEVTIMRDYWCNNKKLFNKALLNYVESNRKKYFINNKAIEYTNSYMGEKEDLHANSWTPSHPIARWMMNAKPDIAIITRNGDTYRLSFIECKYSSREDIYKSEGVNSFPQSKLQEEILNFICNILKAKYNKNPLENGEVKKVRFINNNTIANDEIPVPISILLR